MFKTLSFILCLLVPAFISASNPHEHKMVARGAKLVKLAGGFGFTEGPIADKTGNVYFTDQPNNQILIWTINHELLTFTQNSGRANGLYFDKQGNLLSCSDMENELWSFSPDKAHKVLISSFNEKRLNGPNDLWIHPDGSIYFTDPLYVRPYWTRNSESEQNGEYVYYLSPDYKNLKPVCTDLVKPNGIIGTPDGKKLYVADIGANKTYVYNILPDGSLHNKRVFAPIGSDGMTIDCKGNIYVTGDGVTIFNSKGKKIDHIEVEANWTANVCFGGKDMKTLFITASENLYSIEMKVKGVK